MPNNYTNDRSGPWAAPLRNFDKEERPIKVFIYNLENDSIENEFILNYGSFEDRKFLGKLTFYCITNGRSVETLLLKDDK